MANRINLGGYYPSKGENSLGELRARYYVEYSNALAQKLTELWANNSDEYDNPREVLAAVIAGEFEDEMAEASEVDPDTYDRDDWVEAFESDDSDDSDD